MKRGPRKQPGVGEARVEYVVAPGIASLELWKGARTRLSSKNQITIPVAMCRALDMRPGDELDLWVSRGVLVVERLPRTADEWVASTAGSMSRVEEWSSDEKIDAWTRAIREEWQKDA